MRAPVIWSGVNAKFLNTGDVLDFNNFSITNGVKISVTKTAHGFTSSDIGRPLYFDGTDWQLAQADTGVKAQVAGFIYGVVNANTLRVSFDGQILNVGANFSADGGSLVPGSVYYLSAAQSGKVTVTPPSGSTDIIRPVGIALTSTSFSCVGIQDIFGQKTTVDPFDIKVTSTTPALTIRQLGTGHALLIEDQIGPDSTAFIINNNGSIIKGNTFLWGIGTLTPEIQFSGYDANSSAMLLHNDNNPSSFASLNFTNTSSQMTGAVTSGSDIASIRSYGGTGANAALAAEIKFTADGSPISSVSTPGRISFSTSTSGSATATERLRIDSVGNIDGKTPTGATIPLLKGVDIYDVVDVTPTLDLDFTDPSAVPGSLVFTRNSVAKYYDGHTTAKAEENLVLQSDDMVTAVALTNVTATANTSNSPSGTLTADTVTETTTNGAHYFIKNFAVISGQTYAFSIFAKKGSGATAPDIIQLSFTTSNFPVGYANFNINTGVVGTTSGITSAVITPAGAAGSGWYRISITATATSTNLSSSAVVIFTNNNDSLGRLPVYAGSTTSDVILWGMQLEQRIAVTDYVPTTTQIVRNYVPVLLEAPINTPRIDFDPITAEPKGLLIEESRTNLLTYSEDFSNAVWNKARASISSNIVVAPDGTLTGSKLVEDTSASNTHYLNSSYVASATLPIISIYVKAAERSRISLQVVRDNGGGFSSTALEVNLLTGTKISGPSDATITPVGNGWYRCAVPATSTATTNYGLRLVLFDGANLAYTGNGYSGIYIWGAQLEAGAFPTSYIKTVASSDSRIKEFASLSGSSFTDWYRQEEGSFFSEYRLGFDISSISIFHAEGAPGNTMNIRLSSGSASQFSVALYNTNIVNLAPAGYSTENTFYRRAIGYATNSFQQAINGALPNSEDTNGVMPILSRINLGSNVTSEQMNGHIRRLIYWPERLSNSLLQTITALT